MPCAGSDQPDLEAGVAAIREVLKTLPVRPGVYRMQDARGDVLYVGKARALKNRVTNYTPGRAAPEAAAADGRADPLDDDRHHPDRGRGAAARSAADQALPARLQRAAARRQKLPVHPAARRPRLPADQKHRGARRTKGAILRPVRQRRIGHHARSTRCRSCSCCAAAPTAFSPTASRPCLLYQIKRCSAPCVGRIDEAGLCRAGRRGEGLPRRQVGRGAGAARRSRWRAAAEKLDYRARRDLRDRLRALTFIQGSQTINAEGLGDADVFALACKGGTVSHPGLLHPRRAELGPPRVLPGAYQRRARSRGAGELAGAVLRGRAAAAPDPGRPRAARARAARGGAVRARRARGSRSSVPQRGDRAQADRAGQAQCRGSARPPPRRDRHPGQDPARAGRYVRAARRAASGSRSTTTATSWAPTRSAR